jgi:hypothetical protein
MEQELAMEIDAKPIVRTGFPPDEGKFLADKLLDRPDVDWGDLAIDISKLPPALLISAFFNGFLQEIYDRRRELLDRDRRVRWNVQFDFQLENVAKWMRDFRPTLGVTATQ